MMNTKKRFFLLASICSALLFLAGGAASEGAEKVYSSYPGIAGYNIPFWVAMDTGEFRKAGLDVEAVLIVGGTKSIQAMLSGGLTFSHTSGGQPIQAALNGAEVTIIGTVSNTMSAGIIATKEIQAMRDLKGKKVGIAAFGGNNEVGLRFALKKYGLDASKDVVLFLVGGEKNRLAAMEKGGIAATIISPPGLFVAETMGFRRLVDLNEIGMRYPELSIVARKRDLNEKRDTLRRYLRAHLEAIRTFKTNRPVTVGIIEKYIHVGSKAEANKTYDYFVKSVSDSMRTDLDGIREFLESIEFRMPGAGKRNPADFIDESVLEEALRG